MQLVSNEILIRYLENKLNSFTLKSCFLNDSEDWQAGGEVVCCKEVINTSWYPAAQKPFSLQDTHCLFPSSRIWGIQNLGGIYATRYPLPKKLKI